MQQMTNICIRINLIQPAPTYKPGDIVRSNQQPGSSGNCTTDQIKQMGQNIVNQLPIDAPHRFCLAFPDGSIMFRKSCGAGAVVICQMIKDV